MLISRSFWFFAAAASAVHFGAATPGFSQQSGDQDPQSAETGDAGAPDAHRDRQFTLGPNRMLVTPARLIIGRELLDEADGPAGTIKYLMIDMSSGNVIYALASAEAFGEFKAVPWSAIETEDWVGWRTTGLKVDATEQEFEDAIRYDMEDILRVASPALSREIAGQFAAVEDAPVFGDSILLFGDMVVSELQEPPALTGTQIEGSAVAAAADDVVIGEIDEIMVDVDQGKIPYVLVSVGGFLGGARGWIPIPPQALEWQTEGDRYEVSKTLPELQQLPLAGAPEISSYVRLGDLEALYGSYEIDPYWK